MALFTIIETYASVIIYLAVLAFAILAIARQPRWGNILLVIGCAIAVLDLGAELTLRCTDYRAWVDLYLNILVGLQSLRLAGLILIGIGAVLVLHDYTRCLPPQGAFLNRSRNASARVITSP